MLMTLMGRFSRALSMPWKSLDCLVVLESRSCRDFAFRAGRVHLESFCTRIASGIGGVDAFIIVRIWNYLKINYNVQNHLVK